MLSKRSNSKEYLKFGLVLSLIGLIAVGLFELNHGQSLTDLLRGLMAAFMIIFAGFKLIGYRQFVASFSGYDMIARRWGIYGWLFPWLQLGLGLVYLFNLMPAFRNWLVVVIATLAAVGVWRTLVKSKAKLECACLGRVIKLPLSKLSLGEDLSMLVMAVLMQL